MGETRRTFEDPRVALKRHGFRPKSSWGQNFLISERAVATIAANAVHSGEEHLRVVEIGAGVGTLTAALLSRGAEVVSIERDRDMCRVLRADFGAVDGFALKEADAARVDYRALFASGRGIIAGNLPYQLTGKLIRAIVDADEHLIRAVVMLQEEVAERLAAPPGHSSRGALSAVVQARFEVTVALRLKPTAFYPPPKVRSAVVLLTPVDSSIFDGRFSPKQFDALVNAAFTARRKTIRNSLLAARVGTAAEIDGLLAEAAVNPTLRPERLTQSDFIRMLTAKDRNAGSIAEGN